MSAVATAVRRPQSHAAKQQTASAPNPPAATWREDLVTALLSVILICGLYLDAWNHLNLQDNELGAFLTPWHGLLYFGFTLTALWSFRCVLVRAERFSARALWEAAPTGYRLGLVGPLMVSCAAPGDAFWHTAFGVETGVARVIGVFHLVLFVGIGLIVATPLLSMWARAGQLGRRPSLKQLAPAVISLAMVSATAGFLVQFSSSFVLWHPALSLLEQLPPSAIRSPAVLESVYRGAVSQVLLTTGALMCPLLVGMARLRLPFGAVTAMFGIVGLLSAALNELALPPVVVSALCAGILADVLIRALDVSPGRLAHTCIVGGVVPLGLWGTFFASLSLIEGVEWPRDLWLGATLMAATLSALFGLLVVQGVRGRLLPPLETA